MSARQCLIPRQGHVAVFGYAFHATTTICQVDFLLFSFFQVFLKHDQVILAGPTHTLGIPALGIATGETNLAQVRRHGQTPMCS